MKVNQPSIWDTGPVAAFKLWHEIFIAEWNSILAAYNEVVELKYLFGLEC